MRHNKTKTMKTTQNTDAKLVSFGNYLLSEQRGQTIEKEENRSTVGDWDLANWRKDAGVPENGIYIPDANRELHTLDEWMQQADPTSAQTVVLVTDRVALEIAKEDLPGEFNFDDAQTAAAEYGDGFRNATRHESIEMYDARFRGLDEAITKIGGQSINGGWRWTSEADPDPEYGSDSAFVYSGSTGSVYDGGKYYTYSVRPVRTFKKERHEKD